MLDYVIAEIAQTLFWGTGAQIKKLTGRPPSETGSGEKWLGFLFYLALIVASIVILNVHKMI
jgi:hypothetical protein